MQEATHRRPSTSLVPLRNASLEAYAPEPDNDNAPAGIPLKHRLWVIRRALPAIAGFVAVCTIVTAVISYRIKPIYEAYSTIDVDRRAPSGIVGQDANSNQANDTEQFLNTQVRLIQSDAVLAPVVRRFKMYKAPGGIGFPNLKVTRVQGTFLILITYRSSDPAFAADFTNAIAKTYIEESYDMRYKATLSLSGFMEKEIDELRAKMERSSLALNTFEQQLNMVRPEEANGITSARLLQLNTEYTTAQAERAKKQASYEAVRNGDIDAAEVSTQGEPLRILTDRLNQANERFDEVKRQYGKSHPEYVKAASLCKELSDELAAAKASVLRRVASEFLEAETRESILKHEVTETKAEFDGLNARSFQYENLKREAEADRKLYEELSNRIKEAGINAGFQNSSIRLADPAQPPLAPVFPDTRRNIQLAFITSLFLGIGAALAADSMDATLRSPEDVERAIGAHVVGSLPQVKQWRGGWLTQTLNGQKAFTDGDTRASETRTYEDAILSLRNSILLGSFDQALHTLLITSASPAEGKSTIAAHLAIANAHQKRKTLLIDCDLRRPAIRGLFGLQKDTGMTRILQQGVPWQDQITRHPLVPNLDIILAGNASRREADLVGRYLPVILEEARPDYELIIVDSPPILGFPEPLQLATAVDGVVLVARAGKTNRKAVAAAVSTLRRLRVNLLGLILNEVSRNTTVDYYQYGYSYGYGYRYNSTDKKANATEA